MMPPADGSGLAVAPLAAGAAVAAAVAARAVSTGWRHHLLARLGHTSRDVRPDEPRSGVRGGLLGQVRGLMQTPRASRLAWGAMAAAAAAPVGLRLAGPVGALAGAVVVATAGRAMSARREAARREAVERQLRDAVATLAAGVRAGLSVRRALQEAAGESEEPLRALLEEVLRGLALGRPIEEALGPLARSGLSADIRLLVALLEVHSRTGGDLPTLLDEVSEVIAQRAAVRRELRALTAQGRASGAVLAVLPIAFVSLLSGTSGDGLGAFYRTLPGSALLAAGLACDLLGFVWIRRIARPRGGWEAR